MVGSEKNLFPLGQGAQNSRWPGGGGSTSLRTSWPCRILLILKKIAKTLQFLSIFHLILVACIITHRNNHSKRFHC